MNTAKPSKKLFLVGILILGLGGCSESNGGGGSSGGATNSPGGSGGSSLSTGGSVAGGATSSGGNAVSSSSIASGGAPGTSGATGGKSGAGSGGASVGTSAGTNTGGRVGTGGASAGTGGAAAGGTSSETGGKGSGGATAPGGSNTGRGGTATGGRTGTGGATGSTGSPGGQTTGGTTGAGGAAAKSPGCGKTPTLKSGKALSISVSGTNRTYNLAVPEPYDNTHPYRLIMAYHWLNGTANNVSDGSMAKPWYGLWDQAAGSTIFVAPQGTGNAWSNSGGVDVEFSRQLITLIESEFCIDTTRIFCEGFSMGGSMSYAMACAMGDVIRGIAVHSGGSMSGCVSHNKPVAYFMTHGTQDTMCNYTSFGLKILSDFAKVDGCTTTTADLPVPTSTAGACIDFEGCKPEAPVRACSFVGGHTPSPDGNNGWVPKETWKFITRF